MIRAFKLGTACLIGIVLGGCGAQEERFPLPPNDGDATALQQEVAGSAGPPAMEADEFDRLTIPNANGPDAVTVPASAVSPDGRYRIETYGENREVTAGGLYPVEGIRLINTASGEEIWSMTGYYTQSFFWSSDSRYVAVSYEARMWGGAVIVDAKDGSVIDLPDVEALRKHWKGETTVNETRPDPYFQVTEWLDASRVTVSFTWNGLDGSVYSGTYLFDVESRKIVELSKF